MTTFPETVIEADPHLPLIRTTRDFFASPAQLHKAHTDPDLFAQWIGPHGISTRIIYWDARTGGSWRFVNEFDGESFYFFGSFHEITPDRIVQTFTWEQEPDGVALERLTFEALAGGKTRLVTTALVESFEGRDAWLKSGMEVGMNDGYAKLTRMLDDGRI